MRPKFFAALLSTATLILCAAFYLKQHFGNGGAIPAASAPPSINSELVSTKPEISNVREEFIPVAQPVIVVTNTVTPEQRRAAIDAEVNRLQQLSAVKDADYLPEILDCLTNSEKQIREAALDAAREFGSTNAIPALKAAAEATGDTPEKIAFLEAADFLLLPPMTFASQPVVRTPEQIQADQQRHAQRHPDLNPPTVIGN